MLCHPERVLARFLRQNESKDLLLGYSIYVTNFGHVTLAPEGMFSCHNHRFHLHNAVRRNKIDIHL
jgi:hypothetical protein